MQSQKEDERKTEVRAYIVMGIETQSRGACGTSTV